MANPSPAPRRGLPTSLLTSGPEGMAGWAQSRCNSGAPLEVRSLEETFNSKVAHVSVLFFSGFLIIWFAIVAFRVSFYLLLTCM